MLEQTFRLCSLNGGQLWPRSLAQNAYDLYGRALDNIHFEIEDLESPWTYTEDSFDYIHARMLIVAVSDWDSIDRKA